MITVPENENGDVTKATQGRVGGPGVYPHETDVTNEYTRTAKRGGPRGYPWTPKRATENGGIPPNPATLAQKLDGRLSPSALATVNTFFSNYQLLGKGWDEFVKAQSHVLATGMTTTVNMPSVETRYSEPQGYFDSIADWSKIFSTGPDFKFEIAPNPDGSGEVEAKLSGTLHMKVGTEDVVIAPTQHDWTEYFKLDDSGKIASLRLVMNIKPEVLVKNSTQYDVPTVLTAAREYFGTQAVGLEDRLLAAVDSTTGLIAMNVKNDGGVLQPTNSDNSALDAARTTKGLAQLALSLAESNPDEAKKLAAAAAANWEATRKYLRTPNGLPIHLRTSGATQLGENSTDRRVNADGLYPASDSADMLMLAQKLGFPSAETAKYREALETDVARFLADFYKPQAKTFAYHADANTGSPAEMDAKGAVTLDYPNGVVGNDGAVYGLAGLLIPTLKALGSDADTIDTSGKAGGAPFTAIAKAQLDLISDRFKFVNGAMWETYAAKDDGSLDPIRFAWQDQEVKPLVDGLPTHSHVAIGGHTAMAAGQLAEGAMELHKLGTINDAQLARYLDRSVEIISDAVRHGVINARTGLVQNANMLEIPDGYPDQRTKPGGNDWGQAGWQQRELVQTLLVLRNAGRLDQVNLPDGKNGEDLLKESLATTATGYGVPDVYAGGFGDEWRYHVPQMAAYLQDPDRKIG